MAVAVLLSCLLASSIHQCVCVKRRWMVLNVFDNFD